MIKISKSDINIPNMLTSLRIVLIIPFLVFFFLKNLVGMLCMMVLSALSDMLDGFLARKLDKVTDLGKVLDPIADKLTQVTISFCLAYHIHILIPMFVLFLLKDGFMVVGGAVMIRKNLKPVAAKWYGKVSTVSFYAAVISIVLREAFFEDSRVLLYISTVLVAVTCVLMIFTFIQYARIYAQKTREAKIMIDEEKLEDLKVE